jgi:hypothetical protein
MFRDYLVAVFDDEQVLLTAVRSLRAHGFQIDDVYAPYCVHGLDEAMGLRRSRLPIVTFVTGALGFAAAIGFQFYAAVFDWSIDVGGKPDNSTLAFVPITFEITILCAGLATLVAFLLRCRLFPRTHASIVADGVTDNVFALALRRREGALHADKAWQLLRESGARVIRQKAVDR